MLSTRSSVAVPLCATLFIWLNATNARAQDPAVLAREIERDRALLKGLAKSPLVDSESPRLVGLLTDTEAFIKSGRTSSAVETLAAASPGAVALAKAADGWGQGAMPGKNIDALIDEWEDAGKSIARDRKRFPTVKGTRQSAFLRALAEQSLGQIDEHYAVAVSYGRESGLSSGAYYLGRAQGQMAFALFASNLDSAEARKDRLPPSFKAALQSLDGEIVAAYAKPGSTAQHPNFITANSMLKLAKELDQKQLRYGSLITLMRSAFALALATTTPPAATSENEIATTLGDLDKRFSESPFDESIGAAYVEKARISLEKARAGGDAADRERLRAHAIATSVLPRYIELTGGGK
jgi:hypothetical protein